MSSMDYSDSGEQKEEREQEKQPQTVGEKEQKTPPLQTEGEKEEKPQLLAEEKKEQQGGKQEKEEEKKATDSVPHQKGQSEKKKTQKRPYIDRPVVEMLTKRTRKVPVRLINEIGRRRLAIEVEAPKEEKREVVEDAERSYTILAQLGTKGNVVELDFGTVFL